MGEFDKQKTLKETNQEVKNTLDDCIDSIILQARMIRAKYEALLAEGFNDQQAIELCKKL